MPPEGGGEPELVAAEGEEGQEQEGEEKKEGEQEGEGGEKEAFGDDDDEDDDEGDGDLGMSDEASEADPQRMQFKCAKCATVNEVAPPEGYQLSRAGETMGESERQLRGRISMIERQLEAKEGRFVKTNRNLAQALKENQQLAIDNRKLKSKIIAFDRLEEATKQLKEANIPADILPAKDLVTLYEPEQWDAAIKQAKNMLAREAKLTNRQLSPTREAGGFQGTGKDGEVTSKDLSTKFHEAYSGKSEDKDKDK
jgi:regulator of replication initiation timing